MKWIDIKSDDDLPKRAAEYFVYVDDYKSVGIFDGKHFFSNDNILHVTKWLDQTPSHGMTAEEILKEYYLPVNEMGEQLVYATKALQAMHDYANQAMEEHRTQPQEGREEVECTHPYKECVMSDRVNKYGTPLTKCSVCGNDNICDEELMDESVKEQAGESVDEKIFKEASDYAERVCNGEFPIEYTKEQVVKHTKNDFIAGAKCVISTFQKDNEDQLFRTAL